MFDKFRNNESGQSMVLVGLLLFVLFGFGAMAVDVGYMTYQRSDLQNAADAAALAGAQDLPIVDTAKGVAIDYAEQNGVLATETTATTPYNGNSKEIEVIINKTITFTLAKALGFNESEISVRAVANRIHVDMGPLDYTLFSGKDIVFITSQKETNITGDIYGFDGIEAPGAIVDGDVSVSGNNSIDVDSATNVIKNQIEVTPDFLPFIKESYTKYITNKADFLAATQNGTHLNDDIIYYEGDLDIEDYCLSGKGIIFTTGTLDCGGQTSINDSIIFCSNADDPHAIHYTGSGQNVMGFLLTPHGGTVFSGEGATLSGRIISDDQLKFAGGSADIDGSNINTDVFNMVKDIVKLVE